MQYVSFPGTCLTVSALCLGTMHYGLPLMAEPDAFAQMDAFFSSGGTFIDTAHVYNDWIAGEVSRSEKIIGRYLRKIGIQKDITLSTKGGHPNLDGKNRPRLEPEMLLSDLKGSLANLGVETIDLYFLHRDDPSIPVGEILGVLEDQVMAGNIRYYGCSNWSLARMMRAQDYAQAHGMRGFSVNQIMWSLARINVSRLSDPTIVTMDGDTYAYHRAKNIPIMAFSSQAKGYFTLRLRGLEMPADTCGVYGNAVNDGIEDTLRRYQAQTGCSPTTVALRWMMERPIPCVPIVSCDNMEQLQDVLRACNASLPPGLLSQFPEW